MQEACGYGRDALLKLVKKSPYPDGDTSIYACAYCGCGEYLFNEDGRHNRCCGNCGPACKLKLKQAAQAEEAAKNQCSLFDMEYIEEIKK